MNNVPELSEVYLYYNGRCSVCDRNVTIDNAHVALKEDCQQYKAVDINVFKTNACLLLCHCCKNKLQPKHHKKVADIEIQRPIKEMLEKLGLNLSDPNLADTPRRIATLYELMLEGLDPKNAPEIKTFPNTKNYDQIAIVKAKFMSMCSHHFMPFYGTAYFGYIPDKQLVGLSKIRRVIDYFAHRPQLQENLTEEVIGYLHSILKPKGCMLVMHATHMCIAIKDIAQIDCPTTTSAIKGCFEKPEPRGEFMSLLQKM